MTEVSTNREKFGGFSKSFIIEALENYERLEDEALARDDFALAASISGMATEFLKSILNE